MKKIVNHPMRDTNPTLWRTEGERLNTVDFTENLTREFPTGSGHLSQEEAHEME
jgi:MoCo/4Fe-4S cofactor protein with predicted Tat translocation signal